MQNFVFRGIINQHYVPERGRTVISAGSVLRETLLQTGRLQEKTRRRGFQMIEFNRAPHVGTEEAYIRQAIEGGKLCGDGPFTKKFCLDEGTFSFQGGSSYNVLFPCA